MINKVILVGNLGTDPETKSLQSGSSVGHMRLATSRKYKNKDNELVEETEWHRVTTWGKLADLCGEYLRKGSKVYLEGRLRTSKWQNDAGEDRYTTEVVADTVKFLDSKGDGAPRSGGPGSGPAPAPADDDIPF